VSRSSKNDPTESGVLVYPRLPVPEAPRRSEPRVPRPPRVGGFANRRAAAMIAGGLVAGGLGGFVLRPWIAPDDRIAALEKTAADATAAASVQKDRADGLESKLVVETAAKKELATQLEHATRAQAELAEKAADAEAKAKAVAAEVESKLTRALDKGSGSVSTEGDEIRLQLVDKVLFRSGDDQLTERGKAVLAKVGAALKELPDKQVWVQGHTDDTPIAQAVPARNRKGRKPEPPRFASNWELSAARALTVVHYLQDVAKIEPSRLAALAFGEYRPVSRTNKARNRRIEIVLYPHRAVIDRAR